jgi:lipopolysaccharide export system protein LptC
MSEAAIRQHDVKRHWAEPGSRHDLLVRNAKIGLPVIAAAFLLILAVAPFDRRGDVSFILDKKGVDKAAERMRNETARVPARTIRATSSRSPPSAPSSGGPTSRSSISRG